MPLHRIKNKHELFRLRQGCRVWNDQNITPDIGRPYNIYSPFSKTYYNTQVFEWTAWDILDKFINEGNTYVQ